MFNSNNLQTLAYFIQAILERNYYFVGDKREETFEVLTCVVFSYDSEFFSENYLKLYKIFSEEKPELVTRTVKLSRPTVVWNIPLESEKILRDALVELKRLLEKEKE